MKILTYNILSPTLASYDNYKYHKHCPKKYIIWSYRKKLLLKKIISSKADIVCLQEIQNDIFQNFIPILYKYGYIGIFAPKNKKIINNNIDGCAIFILNKYQFIQFKSLNYQNSYKKFLKKNNLKNDIIRANKPMSAIICLIKKINSKFTFALCTLHLIADPTIPDVKLLQTICTLNELSIMSNSGTIPYILCGDFNSLPDSSVYNTITTGKINYKHIDFTFEHNTIKPKQIKYSIPMISSYKTILKNEPIFTNYTADFKGTLDYIFLSKHWNTKSILPIPPKFILDKETAIPNSKFPSDHLPLMSTITIKR